MDIWVMLGKVSWVLEKQGSRRAGGFWKSEVVEEQVGKDQWPVCFSAWAQINFQASDYFKREKSPVLFF